MLVDENFQEMQQIFTNSQQRRRLKKAGGRPEIGIFRLMAANFRQEIMDPQISIILPINSPKMRDF